MNTLKKIIKITLLLVAVCTLTVKAEKIKLNSTLLIAVDTGKVYAMVDKAPEFPGGMSAFSEYLGKNLNYPKADRENKVTGKVFVIFVVEKDGSLSDVKAVRGVTDAMKKEAERVIANSPKWKPGMMNNQPVRVQYTVPINFAL